MSTKKQKKPIHKMGTNCGYDQHEDGSITPAPMYVELFASMAQERAAVEELTATLVRHSHKLLVPLQKRKEDWFTTVLADYGLDPALQWSFSLTEKRLRAIPRTEEPRE